MYKLNYRKDLLLVKDNNNYANKKIQLEVIIISIGHLKLRCF